jgi:hypothetical protein
MSKEKNNFFDWFVSLFKKPAPPKVVEPTPEEIKKQQEKDEIRKKYNLEYVESYNAYFVKYLSKNQWWYLRRWDEDYTLERVKGNAIRISNPEHLESIIYLHQDWLKEGHIFMSFD